MSEKKLLRETYEPETLTTRTHALHLSQTFVALHEHNKYLSVHETATKVQSKK